MPLYIDHFTPCDNHVDPRKVEIVATDDPRDGVQKMTPYKANKEIQSILQECEDCQNRTRATIYNFATANAKRNQPVRTKYWFEQGNEYTGPGQHRAYLPFGRGGKWAPMHEGSRLNCERCWTTRLAEYAGDIQEGL